MEPSIPSSIQATATTINISVHAKPSSKKNAIMSIDEEAVGVAIAAPPKEGEANKELTKYLSDVLGVKKTQVSLNVGKASKYKIISVKGLTREQVYSKLSANM